MKIKSILSLSGMLLSISLIVSSQALACGGDKDTRLNSDKPHSQRRVQSVSTEPKKVAVQSNEVYGPPAPITELGIAMKLSESGTR